MLLEREFYYSFYPETYYYYGPNLKSEIYKLITYNSKFGLYEYIETKYNYLSKEDVGL